MSRDRRCHCWDDQLRKRWRQVLAVDLGAYSVAMFFFAFLPPSTLSIMEIGIMGLTVACLVGVVSRATDRVQIPLERWAYLLTGFVGVVILLLYVTMEREAPWFIRVPFALFLASGVASAFAAHVIAAVDVAEQKQGDHPGPA